MLQLVGTPQIRLRFSHFPFYSQHFTVSQKRLIPFDIIPRVIPSAEWKALQAGLRQRVKALNMFLWDV
ncbi:MAG: circularly permuted type 2 ATP-grasp protein, partial [Selenomonadaceae bacterium]